MVGCRQGLLLPKLGLAVALQHEWLLPPSPSEAPQRPAASDRPETNSKHFTAPVAPSLLFPHHITSSVLLPDSPQPIAHPSAVQTARLLLSLPLLSVQSACNRCLDLDLRPSTTPLLTSPRLLALVRYAAFCRRCSRGQPASVSARRPVLIVPVPAATFQPSPFLSHLAKTSSAAVTSKTQLLTFSQRQAVDRDRAVLRPSLRAGSRQSPPPSLATASSAPKGLCEISVTAGPRRDQPPRRPVLFATPFIAC